MHTKQTILVIGTGNTGEAIASHLSNGNFHVLLFDKDYSKAESLVNELKQTGRPCDMEAMPCSFESAWESDIILLALSFAEQKEVVAKIQEVVNQKLLISLVDASISITPNYALEIQAELLHKLLPNTKIVLLETAETESSHAACSKHLGDVVLSSKDEIALEIVTDMLASVGIKSITKINLTKTPLPGATQA
ncbi:MAG: NAD(P)-binding domain-containing protein [Ferruginibacter sp.]